MNKYRPPDSDSDDSYDGLYFDDDPIDKPVRAPLVWRADSHQQLYDAAVSGDFDKIKDHLSKSNADINEPLRNGLTLLHHAAYGGQIEIVTYLLENGANPNHQINSVTPMMSACSCINDDDSALEIVRMLFDREAIVNISDRYGVTPLILASKNGHTKVTRFLIEHEAFLEACDNDGCTPLFHAIENNHPECVQVLIDAGADANAASCKGYTPRQVAQFCGFYDMFDILPPEDYQYIIPTSYLSYNKLNDHIPRLFGKNEMPEYFPDIDKILRKYQVERFLENFAKYDIKLVQFLTVTDDALKEIDVELSVHRKKILTAVLRYHLEHWSIEEIERVKRNGHDNFYRILMLISNHLRNLVIISSALKYIQQNIKASRFGTIDEKTVKNLRNSVQEYKKALGKLQSRSRFLDSICPKVAPMCIDYDVMVAAEKRNKIWGYVKKSMFLSAAVVILLKWKKLI